MGKALSGVLSCALTLKEQSKTAADVFFFFYFYLSKKIRLDVHVNPLLDRGFT